MRKLSITLISLLLFFVTACSSTDFDRKAMLQNAANNLIIPAYMDFNQKTDSLLNSVQRLNENPNSKTLATAQNAWKETILSWKRAELYNFGPVEEKALAGSIDRWPTSEGGIESAIQEYDNSENYLVRIGSNRKGLPAIEYLLFHGNEDLIIQEFQNENRKRYLELLSKSLVNNSELILDEWEGGYQQKFIEATGNRPNSGLTLMANEIGFLLEMVRMDKLEVPFGKQTGGVLRLQMLESEYAHISKELIYENLKSAQNTFNGGEGKGFDDYLDALGIEGANGSLLSESINAEYDNASSLIEGMDGSLEDAMQNNKQSVEQLIESVQQLYIYNEVDMISQLSLLDTFSDNDGD